MEHFTFPVSNFINRTLFGPDAPVADQTIHVDPAAVTQAWLGPGYLHLSGRIGWGNWDRRVTPFASLGVVSNCAARLAGQSWEEIGAYDALMERVQKQGKADGCRTYEDVVERFRRLDRLIDDMRATRRLKPPREIYGPEDRWESGIVIHIARDGEPIFGRRGHHRLAIAQLLELSDIPATVGIVHVKAVRDGTFARIAARSG